MNPRLLSLALLPLSLVSVASVRAQATLPKDIFTPPAAAGVTTAPAETIEFSGVTKMGAKVDLIFFDKTAKRSRTVSVGETAEGIQVLRYDADKDQAVVKINGVQKTLPLRKGSGPTNTPAPVAPMPTGFNVPTTPAPNTGALVVNSGQSTFSIAPTTPAPVAPVAQPPAGPATPETIAKQETEARMLVSDLLEIGMAQRKAYEEAQRRAQDGNTTPAAPTAPAQPPPK